jgi:hypothetical protein
MRAALSNRRFLFAVLFLTGTAVALLCGLYSRFYVSSNDFWSVLYYGRHITWAEKESLYNGYYPIGYAFLVGQMPYGYVLQLAYIMNACLSGLFVASVTTLVAGRRFIPATLFVLVISLAEPLIYQYSNTAGPDIGTAAFPAFAVYLLWEDAFAGMDESHSRWRALLIGACLGLGFLWRTHVIVMSVAIIILAFLFRRIRTLHASALMALAFLGLASIQVAANLLSGHGAFETAQVFNVYKFLFGVDWTTPPTPEDIAGFSLWRLLQTDPWFVINAARPFFQYLVWFAWPGMVCFLLAPRGEIRRFVLFSILTIVIYAIPLSLSDSPRGLLPILGLYLACLGLLLVVLVDRLRGFLPSLKWLPGVVALLVLAFSAGPIFQWILQDRSFLQENRLSHRVFMGIEQILVSRGVTSPDQVFSNKYQLYLPDMPPYTPRHLASWSNDWMWGFVDEYPPLSNESWEAFRQSCLREEIKFIVLSPLAVEQGEFFAVIYEDDFDEDAVGLEFIAARAKMRIYQFK